MHWSGNGACWGVRGVHMRVGVQMHNPCTLVCVSLKCTQQASCHISVQMYRCACSDHTACVYLLHAHLCAQVYPIHGTYMSLCTLSCDMGSTCLILVCLTHAYVYWTHTHLCVQLCQMHAHTCVHMCMCVCSLHVCAYSLRVYACECVRATCMPDPCT